MRHVIAGLGNPGEEYDGTRHNVGRMMVEAFRKAHAFPEWDTNKKLQALTSEGALKRETVLLVEPETYMNKSGGSITSLVTSAKKAERLVVVHDDIDLPLGSFKIVFGRGSGGHKGVESVMRAIKTKSFVRIKVGVVPTTPTGKLKKPQAEKQVLDFILGKFNDKEQDVLKKTKKKVLEALETIVVEGRARAMNVFNSDASVGTPTRRRRG